jgi:hypothetical protein
LFDPLLFREIAGQLPAVLAPDVPAREGHEVGRRHEEDFATVDAGKPGKEPQVEHPGLNIIKLFYPRMTYWQNELESLALTSFFSLVLV